MKNLRAMISNHKIIASVCCTVSVLLVVCVVMCANSLKFKATDKALEYAEKGYITEEELKDISSNGEIVLGEEIVTPSGETVILSQDENGNIVSTTVKDAQGNTLIEGNNESLDAPHSHIWVNHYATKQVQSGTRYVVDQQAQYKMVGHTYCKTCHQIVDGMRGIHGCDGGMYCTYEGAERELVQNEVGHMEPVYTNTEYVDFIYCSSCGAHKN